MKKTKLMQAILRAGRPGLEIDEKDIHAAWNLHKNGFARICQHPGLFLRETKSGLKRQKWFDMRIQATNKLYQALI
jgi:hypothetical protein